MSIAKKDWWVYTVWTRQCDVFSIQTILWRLEHSDDCFPKQESCCFTSASCEKDATKDELRSISLHTLRLCQQITDVKRGTLMSCDQPLHVAKVSKQTTINDDVSVLQECFKMSHDVSPSFVNSLMDMGQQTVQQPDFWPWRFFHKNWSWSVFLDAYFPTKQRGYCAGLQLLYTSINFLPLSSSAFEQKANAFLEKHTFSHIFRKPLGWQVFKHQGSSPITMGCGISRRLIWRKRRLKYLHLTDSLKLQGFFRSDFTGNLKRSQLRCWLHDPNELLNPDPPGEWKGRENTSWWKDPNHLT